MFAAAASEFPNDNPELHYGACWVLARLDEGLVAEVGRVVGTRVDSAPPAVGGGTQGLGGETPVIESGREVIAASEEPALDAVVAAEVEVEAVVEAEAVEAGAVVEPEAVVEAEVDPEPTVPTPRVSETVAVRSSEVVVGEAVAEASEAESLEEETPAPSSEMRRAVVEDGFVRFVNALVEIAEAEGARAEAGVLPGLLGLEAVGVEGTGAAVRGLVGAGFGVESDGTVRASARLEGLVLAWGGVLRKTGDFSACGDETLNEWAAELLAAVLGDRGRAAAMQYQLRRRGVAAFGMVQLAA